MAAAKAFSLQKKLSECLLDSSNSTDFAVKAFAEYSKEKPSASYASLSRKMGFESRSFVRQLALGKRQLNLQNFKQVALGLELSTEATEFLGVWIEAQKYRGEIPISAKRKLAAAEVKLRRSLLKKSVRSVRRTDPILFERWPFIYAALGTPATGRRFSDIVSISGQGPKACLEILELLQKQQMIRFDSKLQKYFAIENIIDIGELGESSVLRNLYKHVSLESLRRIEVDLNNPHCLFHTSVFSVHKECLPDLTRDIQALLTKYAADSEEAGGEHLALLNCGLIPLKN